MHFTVGPPLKKLYIYVYFYSKFFLLKISFESIILNNYLQCLDKCQNICLVENLFIGGGDPLLLHTLLEKLWRISLYLTDDAIAKLHVTYSLVT